MSCGVGCRRGSGPTLLWLWQRLASVAPIGPLAWEPPWAAGVAQEMAKRQKKKKKRYGNLRGSSVLLNLHPMRIFFPEGVKME